MGLDLQPDGFKTNRPGHLQVTFVTDPIVALPTTGFNSEGMSSQTKTRNDPSTCILSSSSRYLGKTWGGPHTLLGLRGKAIHA